MPMHSAGIEVQTTSRGVLIAVRVGEKVARIVVTPERAQSAERGAVCSGARSVSRGGSECLNEPGGESLCRSF